MVGAGGGRAGHWAPSPPLLLSFEPSTHSSAAEGAFAEEASAEGAFAEEASAEGAFAEEASA